MPYILTSKRYGFQLPRNIINKFIGKTIHFAFEVQIVFTHYFCLEKVVIFFYQLVTFIKINQNIELWPRAQIRNKT